MAVQAPDRNAMKSWTKAEENCVCPHVDWRLIGVELDLVVLTLYDTPGDF